MITLDCTLRDGGYYNKWDFPHDVVQNYLSSMSAAGIDVVEIGMRSLFNKGFKGAYAYSTEGFLSSLNIPSEIKIAVMINASELAVDESENRNLQLLFPVKCSDSFVDIVRVACHFHEFESSLPISNWLSEQGYKVCFNIMQISDRSDEEIINIAEIASKYPIDVLYFADSTGSMQPEHVEKTISLLRRYWTRDLGIHAHDNMGLALQNTLRALDAGVIWLDSTVTGMGRGPGNVRTEELIIETSIKKNLSVNLVPLMSLIRCYFQPLKNQCGWGSNPYYYLSGKYGIHPTYIQEMLNDSRYNEEDIFAAIEHLRLKGGKKFSSNSLDGSRNFYSGDAQGTFVPENVFSGCTLLLLGTGPGVQNHRSAIEYFIRHNKPIVLALNTQSSVDTTLINYRVACHPIRLLADCDAHLNLPQPLITPLSMLPVEIKNALKNKHVLDFGLEVVADRFEFYSNFCKAPTSLVVAYALALAASAKVKEVYMAGFDGYSADDARNTEMNRILSLFAMAEHAVPVTSITPTRYNLNKISVYAL